MGINLVLNSPKYIFNLFLGVCKLVTAEYYQLVLGELGLTGSEVVVLVFFVLENKLLIILEHI